MKQLALTLPGGQAITAPKGVPTGGLDTGGAGTSIITTGIYILIVVAIIMTFFYLIYGGFKWMTSGGDQEKLAAARQTIIFAIVGLTVTTLSFTIINFLGSFLGIPSILSISFFH